MKIISISGLDGSGKSTQVELLKKYLESQGRSVFYFHAIEQSFAKKLKDFRNKYCLICKLTGKCKNSSVEEKSITKANWLQIQLRKIFLLIDICRFKSFSKKTTFDFIISDRYFYDSAINIKHLSKKNIPIFTESLIPSPEIRIFLDVNPESIMQRKRVPDQGLDYLKSKNDLFKKNIENYGLTVIKGDGDIKSVFEKIKSNLNI